MPYDNYHIGLIGNGRTGALVDREATMVFACLPDFDSGAAFCHLLDDRRGGRFGISMVGGSPVKQRYLPHTNILVTSFEGADGSFEVVDFMPRYRMAGRHVIPYAPPDIIRMLTAVEGRPRLRVDYEPRLEFGAFETATHSDGEHVLKSVTSGRANGRPLYESIYLYTDIPLAAVNSPDPFVLEDDRFLLVSYNEKLKPPDPERVRLWYAQTEAYWLGWVANTMAPPRYREEVLRSAMVLKLMQFDQTGALVAAPTTSLPETIGEVRNWDYRYCWLRDASMTVSVLCRIGHADMAHRFVEWVLEVTPTKDDPLQIMYGLRGERQLTERELTHLSGYQGSRPVRVGNAAYRQRQHDIYGAVLDVFWQTLDHFTTRQDIIEDLWTRVRSVVRTVARVWRQPDRGIWEFRSGRRHFVFSKMLCWVAVDRAVRIADRLGCHEWAEQNRPLADRIRDDIMDKGWSKNLGAFAQSYESDEPDAANLLMADYGLLSPQDERYVATVNRTWDTLGRGDGLLMRYRASDDFGEPRSAFVVCCFWGIKALVRIGDVDRAEHMFARLLQDTNHLGLLAEDLDVHNRRQLGNFPQAYSHLALIDAALALNEARGWRNGARTIVDRASS